MGGIKARTLSPWSVGFLSPPPARHRRPSPGLVPITRTTPSGSGKLVAWGSEWQGSRLLEWEVADRPVAGAEAMVGNGEDMVWDQQVPSGSHPSRANTTRLAEPHPTVLKSQLATSHPAHGSHVPGCHQRHCHRTHVHLCALVFTA